MSKQRHAVWLQNERGGVQVLILGLFAVAAMILLFVVSVNVSLHMAARSGVKDYLDIATAAAALDINETEASYGRLVWDEAKGSASFNKYLQLTLRLDANNEPQPGSFLHKAPIIHYLGFVTHAGYPYTYSKSVKVRSGTDKETIRSIEATLYGPSVVAIVEVEQNMYGEQEAEPIVVPSVSSIRPRY
ncbi:hypothetical protein B5M42_000070 [Paenibacillus athensensis]|uniref:Uncharacterized protein n=1 Tax=Paenibacillus athensensis TaxID=1967502 RepID=A0A4Y8PUM3_9BACL|nr:hypothetical protein [Paenibacillus athensensis]MCD1257229.1 hypothetical protein [Paenibacillus athensensis]